MRPHSIGKSFNTVIQTSFLPKNSRRHRLTVFSPDQRPRFKLNPGRWLTLIKEGRLTKFITRLNDGVAIESVIVPMTRYQTLCVSSQAGCRMGCRFCQTAKMGFKRDLTVSEIIGQLFHARFVLRADIKNIVFMGMGEPLDNFENVIQAIQIMNEQRGLNVSLKHITISTAGIIEKINQLGRMQMPGIRLAISINNTDEKGRSWLMPVNKKNSLAELKTALFNYPLTKRGCFLFEYILIKDLNDTKKDAIALAAFVKPFPARLNLIPYNRVEGFNYLPPSDQEMHEFADILNEQGVFVITRWSKGRSVSAGCGQLGGINNAV
jgi:23S rRNA (adenine2503-C2)-methyltransferase